MVSIQTKFPKQRICQRGLIKTIMMIIIIIIIVEINKK